MFKKSLAFLAIFFSSFQLYAESLVFTIDLIRHGDRNPLHTLTTNEIVSEPGQLTSQGMRQAYQLGAKTRQLYIDKMHLLPAHYQASSIYIRSTDIDRTLMTAQSFLLGLYPLGTGPNLPDSTEAALPQGFQPIPIHTMPTRKDKFLFPDFNEQWNNLLKTQIENQKEWKEKTKLMQPKFQSWSQKLDIKITNLRQLIALSDTLYIYQLHHITFPKRLSDEDIKEIIAAGRWAVTTQFKNKKTGGYLGNTLLKGIGIYIKQASDHKNELKSLFLFAHDTTILSLMSVLGAPLNDVPPYVADVKIALYETDDHQFKVNILFNDKAVYIPACHGTTCTLTQFLQLSKANEKLSTTAFEPV